jgi:hypothetical protein
MAIALIVEDQTAAGRTEMQKRTDAWVKQSIGFFGTDREFHPKEVCKSPLTPAALGSKLRPT